MDRKYYFIYYKTRGRGGKWQHFNHAIDAHPMMWLKDIKANIGFDEHVLCFYEEISQKMYEHIHRSL